jgi:UDP-N-acetylglucosamine:LPS N-acetylglucosamine transferase
VTRDGKLDVLCVCTAGGHLLQLWTLRGVWEGYEHAWVVAAHEGTDVQSLLTQEEVHFAHSPANRSFKNLVRNLAMAWRLLGRRRPEVILTTGAAVAVPYAWMGRLRRIKVVYVESLARAESPSLSCRLIAPVATRLYVQWPELQAKLPRARYAGTVFSAP